ncbi:MAG: PfkB family carbohydrate kinase [Desulfobacterales bacterium]
MLTDISQFDHCRMLVAGDLMIDEYVWGKVERISPEAPVQIVEVEKEEYTLGGAGNVVNNLAVLGAQVSVAGVIGTKKDGDRVLEMFAGLQADTEGVIRESQRPTTRKTRVIAASQHVLRIDRETRREISDATFEKLSSFVQKKIPECDAVLISDYGKGLMTRPFLKNLISLAQKHGKISIADPKGLDFTKYAGVSLLTPNKKEAALAAGMEIRNQDDLFRAGRKLLESTGIQNLLITCGKDGMVLFEPGQEPHVTAEARQVFDVLEPGILWYRFFDQAIGFFCLLGMPRCLPIRQRGIVGKVEPPIVTRNELLAAMGKSSDEILTKYKNLKELTEIAKDLKRRNRKIVLSNGCFDLLHAGHIRLFSASKQMGDVLIAAIDDDASVRSLKGEGRPVISARERVQILSALDSVDYVTVFSYGQLSTVIESIRPDILTKGSNYAPHEVIGNELVEKLGGRVVLIPVRENTSSSDIINGIKAR